MRGMRNHNRVIRAAWAAMFAFSASAFAQAGRDIYGPRPLWERVEVALTAGYGLSFADWTSLHLKQSTTPAGFRVSAQNRFQMSARGALLGGASTAFFFRSGLILQGGFAYLKSGVKNETPFEFQYSRPPALSRLETFGGSGELTSVPVYVNILNPLSLFRGPSGRAFKAYLSVGPALFFNSLVVDAFAGAAAVVPAGTGGAAGESADGLKVPVAVGDQTWVSLGGNVGLALDYQFARPFALTAEVRYFYAPKKNLAWKWEAGAYDGLYGNVARFDFTTAMAADYTTDTTPIVLRPSFLLFAAGFKVIF